MFRAVKLTRQKPRGERAHELKQGTEMSSVYRSREVRYRAAEISRSQMRKEFLNHIKTFDFILTRI